MVRLLEASCWSVTLLTYTLQDALKLTLKLVGASIKSAHQILRGSFGGADNALCAIMSVELMLHQGQDRNNCVLALNVLTDQLILRGTAAVSPLWTKGWRSI